MKGWVLVAILLCVAPHATTGQVNVPRTSSEYPQFFWRADPSQFVVEDARVFPQVALGASNNLENLGRAWIGWTLNFSGTLIAAYGIYDHGQLRSFNSLEDGYKSITWYALESYLFIVGVTHSRTDVNIVTTGGQVYKRQIIGATENHQMFLEDGSVVVYAYNTGVNQSYYYRQQSLVLDRVATSEKVIAASYPGAVIDNSTSRLFHTDQGNVTLPDELSDNLVVGQLELNPVVFDLDNKLMWSPTGSVIELPQDAWRVGFFGLQSSLVYGNSSIYEYDDHQWNEIASFDQLPLDFSIVDIGLYLGPVRYHGLGLVYAGFDEDGDRVPDTLEDYRGSLSTAIDTDGDGIDDGKEYAFGTDPVKADADLDYDRDGLSNRQEINAGTDPLNPDSDYGGALDGWELKFGYDPTSPMDDGLDEDNDGVNNALESRWGSNPRLSDTDQDGMPDKWEIENGIDPTVANANEDPDNDGWSNIQEYRQGTDPLFANSRPLFDTLLGVIAVITALMLPLAILIWQQLRFDFK